MDVCHSEVVARSGDALLGGGVTEVHMADAIAARARNHAKVSPGEAGACRAARIIAVCLLDAAACLMPRTAPSEVHGSAALLRPASCEHILEGARSALHARSPGPLEAETPKRCALLGALDLAGLLLRLGGTLHSSSWQR